MSAGTITGISRRGFLKTGVAGATGLVIGFYLPGRFEAFAAAPAGAEPASLNAWMLISPDDSVKIMIDKSEMGQGILTALCMIAAEELDCDWKKSTRNSLPPPRNILIRRLECKAREAVPACGPRGTRCARPGPPRATCCCRPPRHNGKSTSLPAGLKTASSTMTPQNAN